jgi:NADH dehydrogenase/NADH:ubiquinone oxidoreductase subunit G
MTEEYMLRAMPLRGEPVSRVDREAHIIYGVSAAQPVEALGHDMILDRKAINQIVEHGNAARNGVKSRFTHPGLSSNGLGKYLGRLRDFREEGGKAVADLHIADSAFKTPEGDLGTYVMDLAEGDPDMFGMSVVIKGQRVWTLGDGSEVDIADEEGRQRKRPDNATTDKPVMRVKQLMAVDAVDEPAANRDGLFAARHLWATNALSQEAFDDIDEYLNGAGVTPQRAFEFALSYFAARGVNLQEFKQMAEEKQETRQPEPAGGSSASNDTALAELQTQMAALQSELAAKGEREAALLAALHQAGERISSLEGEAMRERFGQLAADWHGETAKHVAMLEKLAQLDGEAGDSFQFYVQTQNALAEQMKASELFKEKGTDKPGSFSNTLERVNTLAAAYVKDGATQADALARVFREHQELYDQYAREVRGGK